MSGNSEPLALVSTWADPDENDGEWPYPTEYVKSEVHGELADRCRTALGVGSAAPVYITEEHGYGGYSEYTQENWTSFAIECDGVRRDFDEDWRLGSTFEQLLKWLDGEAP